MSSKPWFILVETLRRFFSPWIVSGRVETSRPWPIDTRCTPVTGERPIGSPNRSVLAGRQATSASAFLRVSRVSRDSFCDTYSSVGLGSRWWPFHTVLDRNLDRWERVERVLYLSLRRHVRSGESGICWPLATLGVVWSVDLEIGRPDFVDAILVSICDQKLWKFSKSFNCVEDESFYLWRFFFFLSWERVNNSWALSWKSCRSNHNNYDVLCFMMLF